MRKLFGTDGIRGVANEFPMTVEVCHKLANAIVSKFCDIREKRSVVLIGKDTRISGDIFEHALAASLASLGVDVKLLGIIPTPAMSVLIPRMHADLGIIISASHNPFYDNGIKLFNENGLKLTDAEELELESLMEQELPRSTHEHVGTVCSDYYHQKAYTDIIKNELHLSSPNLKVVIDSSNGALSHLACGVYEELGIGAIGICKTPNGTNINANCGVMHPQALVSAVLDNRADVGIAFDGDGDRVILVDETGKIIDGNQILAALSQTDECREIVSTVMANYGLEKYLMSVGKRLVRTPVGDRYISEYMRNNPTTLFGGEPSGHIIIKSHALTGDGLFASLKLIDLLSRSHKKCSEFFNIFTLYPTVSKNVQVKDKQIILCPKIQQIISQCSQKLEGNGKLIVRASGTEPLIRITAEGEDEERLHDIVDSIMFALQESK